MESICRRGYSSVDLEENLVGVFSICLVTANNFIITACYERLLKKAEICCRD